MPKLPVLSGPDVVKILVKELSFEHIRTAGSHAILRKIESGKKITVPVPLHKELAVGTLLSIIHQAGLTREQFMEMAARF